MFLYLQTEHTTPQQIFTVKGNFRRKGMVMVIQLTYIHLFL